MRKTTGSPRRFYWSDSLADRLLDTRGFAFHERLYAMIRPADDIGYGLRFAYYETIQEALMDAITDAMREASVPLLGTHEWSGDRDRAIYNTFDPLQFSRVRTFGASDISGFQGDTDYATQEPLMAYAQKTAYGKPRAMLMTDYFREPVDLDWLLHTCERHAALGVDYILLHAFGAITSDPPLWTRVESWNVYREPYALERYTSRMKQLGVLAEYRDRPNVLVVFPRYSRLVAAGDRYATREWAKTVYMLYRAHYAPLTISQADFGALVFDGGRVRWRAHTFDAVVLPYFTAMDERHMKSLATFHAAGGHVLLTKPNPVVTDARGRICAGVERLFRQMFGITSAPVVGRFSETGEEIRYEGEVYRGTRLRDGVSEFDDCVLAYDGRNIIENVSPGGGRATLLGFELAALSFGEDLHKVERDDGIRLLDAILGRIVPKTARCTDMAGRADYGTIVLVRERDGELLLTAHRMHDRAVIVHAGAATVHIPAGPRPDGRSGASVFVHHVEEQCVVLCNPFPVLLRDIDLGRDIADIITYDGCGHYCLFAGGRIGCALPPGREIRFADVEYGKRDPRLPSGWRGDQGDILSAETGIEDPGRTVVRVRGPGTARFSVSLDRSLGETMSARCLTTDKPCDVRVAASGGRLAVSVAAEVFPTIENDVEILQTAPPRST